MNTRREFLHFMGRSMAVGALLQVPTVPSWAGDLKNMKSFNFEPIQPTDKDDLVLAKGFEYETLIKWEDAINNRGELFGFNNDYVGFILDQAKSTEAFLWVNHESPNSLFINRGKSPFKTREQVVAEQKAVGGSILKIRKQNQKWQVIKNHPINKRIDGTTAIPFSNQTKIAGQTEAIGTFANCGGGVTPWGSFLSCEENYDQYYGESVKGQIVESACVYDWQKHFKRPPEHYGWVVEITPQTGTAKKLIPLGRFAHEAALVVPTEDGRVVVYMGDDANDQHVYKFISSKPGSLTEGDLYVANTEKGEWILLDQKKNQKLQKEFKDQVDLLINTRQAAKIVGATPLDRPEDIKRDPLTGAVFVALSNNKPKNRPHGSLLKINEKDNNPMSLQFQASNFIYGGEETGFSCPDNLAFDNNGNLWVAVDMSGTDMHKAPYTKFKNNGLFVIPAKGPRAGSVLQVASAPKDAEFTGLCFTNDQKVLFLSVQHPGETTKDYSQPTSHWPEGKNKTPRPSVVAITGPGLWSFTKS